jgi:hypothetical protein
MQEFVNCLFTTNGMAYGTGVLIFLITLFLVARRIIGFTLTLLFLIFALLASFAVANKDLIRSYFENLSKGGSKATSAQASPQASSQGKAPTYQSAENSSASKEVPIMEQLQKAYDDLKEEFEIQKKKFQSFIEEKKQESEKTENPAPPEQNK